MSISKKILLIVITIGVLTASYLLSGLYVFIETDQGIQYCMTASSGDKLSLYYIHSVQLTPVYENFVVVGPDDLLLYSTQYSSYGVGLPSLPSDGIFTQTKDGFDLKLERHFSVVKVRSGPEAKLSIIYNGQVLPVYQELPSGTLIRIRVGRYYTRWL